MHPMIKRPDPPMSVRPECEADCVVAGEDAVQSALLDLGLEDAIPVWEAVTDPDVVAAVPAAHDPRPAVANALVALAQAGRVSFYLGQWDAEPARITRAEGIALLGDPRWFSADSEPEEQRLYFVNIENVPDE